MSDCKALAEKAVSVFADLDTCEYRDSFLRDTEELFQKGWEYRDVISYLRTFEEVSPELAEEVALNRRQSLYAKYLHLYIDLHENEFQSLAPLMG